MQLFERDGGQWAEVFRDEGNYGVEIFRGADLPSLRFEGEELITALRHSIDSLRERLGE